MAAAAFTGLPMAKNLGSVREKDNLCRCITKPDTGKASIRIWFVPDVSDGGRSEFFVEDPVNEGIPNAIAYSDEGDKKVHGRRILKKREHCVVKLVFCE